MTIQTWLQDNTKKLLDAGITSARLDCLILLEDVLTKDRTWILSHPEIHLPSICTRTDLVHMEGLVARRVKHEPLAYIRGKCAFYGREFLVSPATLQPRPESESIITLLLEDISQNSPSEDRNDIVIWDIGTGSGCLAITAKLALPHSTVYSTDISSEALAIAEQNAQILSADVSFYQGDLLAPLENQKTDNQHFAILANLPYVPEAYKLNQSAMHEPRLAIFGGDDGLDLYRKMFMQLDKYSIQPGIILTESLEFQHNDLSKIANRHNYTLTKTRDLIQQFEPNSLAQPLASF